jgi:hypothetical protein
MRVIEPSNELKGSCVLWIFFEKRIGFSKILDGIDAIDRMDPSKTIDIVIKSLYSW